MTNTKKEIILCDSPHIGKAVILLDLRKIEWVFLFNCYAFKHRSRAIQNEHHS